MGKQGGKAQETKVYRKKTSALFSAAGGQE